MGAFGAGVLVGVALLLLHQHLWRTTPARHGRYRMRAWLANAIYDGRLRPVSKVKKGKLVVKR